MRTYNISAGDFPDVAKFRQVLSTHEACRDFTKFKKLDEKLLKVSSSSSSSSSSCTRSSAKR